MNSRLNSKMVFDTGTKYSNCHFCTDCIHRECISRAVTHVCVLSALCAFCLLLPLAVN